MSTTSIKNNIPTNFNKNEVLNTTFLLQFNSNVKLGIRKISIKIMITEIIFYIYIYTIDKCTVEQSFKMYRVFTTLLK